MGNCIERDIFVLRDVGSVAQPIEYVQGTNEVPILLHIRDYIIPAGSTARVYVEWPSTKGEYDSAIINGNDVCIDVKDTMFSEIGKCFLQLCIVNGEKTLVTFKYPVLVKENRVPGITEQSKNQSDFLEEYLKKIDERLDASEKANDDAMQVKASVDSTAIAIESNAETVEINTKATEKNATLAKSYTVGGTETRENEDVDNAKYYYQQVKQVSQGLNGIINMGTVKFENLPTTDIVVNAMYNISNGFTSDERFNDGGGIYYGPGNNVVWTKEEKWDVTASSNVTGIKGVNQDEFQLGNVVLSAEDVGAVAIGGDIAENTVTYTETTELAEITPGEKLSMTFGKIKLAVKNVISIIKLLGNTDISKIEDGTVTGILSALNTNINELSSDKANFTGNTNISAIKNDDYLIVTNQDATKHKPIYASDFISNNLGGSLSSVISDIDTLKTRVGYLDYCGANGDGYRINCPCQVAFNGNSYGIANLSSFIPDGYQIDVDFPTIIATLNTTSGLISIASCKRYSASQIYVQLNQNCTESLTIAFGVRLRKSS